MCNFRKGGNRHQAALSIACSGIQVIASAPHADECPPRLLDRRTRMSLKLKYYAPEEFWVISSRIVKPSKRYGIAEETSCITSCHMIIKTALVTNQPEMGNPLRKHLCSTELTLKKFAASLGVTLLALAGGLLLGGEAAQAANLLRNGSFEIGRDPGRGFSTLPPKSTAINGWTVTRSSIDYISGFWQAADGNRSIDLNGSNAGGIAQTFSTTVGQNYLVTFALAGNPQGRPILKEMRVAAAGQSADFSFNTTGKRLSDMGWLPKSWQFTAVDMETTLEFFSLSQGKGWVNGPALDNVSVVAISQAASVPEPSSVAGLIAFGALGVGWMRKRGGNKLIG